MSAVFMDSNVPMYLVGASHANKTTAARTLRRLVEEERRLVTDAEVLQEILHRYVAIGRRDAVQPAFDVVTRIADEVLPVERADVEHAKNVVLGAPKLSARDAIHVAVMVRHGVGEILTFDRAFDGRPDVRRVPLDRAGGGSAGRRRRA